MTKGSVLKVSSSFVGTNEKAVIIKFAIRQILVYHKGIKNTEGKEREKCQTTCR